MYHSSSMYASGGAAVGEEVEFKFSSKLSATQVVNVVPETETKLIQFVGERISMGGEIVVALVVGE